MNSEIIKKYGKKQDWFIDFVGEYENQSKVNKLENIDSYLAGNHKIKQRPNEKFNGREFESRKIVLQYAKLILNFQVNYLLKNPVTLSGNDVVVNEFEKVYRSAKLNQIDYKLLEQLVKYGEAYEYIYLDRDNKIKSKILDSKYSYPLYDHTGEMIAFVYAYMHDGIDYYTIYYNNVVETYNNEGGSLRLTGRYNNLSGLPIVYKNGDEPRSDLDDYISILDSIEDLISKAVDSFYRYITGIPIVIGQQLRGDGLPADVVGGGLTLDDGADFKFVSNKFDSKAFETLYKHLMQSLLDISSTPSVALNKTDISNLSEVSIQMLFTLSDIKAGLNEKYMREGFYDRFKAIRKLLSLRAITFSDDDFDTLDVVFRTMKPRNDKEVIENLEKLNNMKAISIDTVLEHIPYVSNKEQELERLRSNSNNVNNEELK